MTITPYKNQFGKSDKSEHLYFRIKLSNSDNAYIKDIENLFYQLKCIGATKSIIDNKDIFKIGNIEFNDRIRPNADLYFSKKIVPFIPFSEKKRGKAEFGILLRNNLKKSLVIVLKIEFFEDSVRFLDVYLVNRWGVVIDKYIDKRNEYILAFELEKIYNLLFSLPKQLELCKSCSFYDEYKANGFCIKYHPESGLPSRY